jgi:glycosyltransferase involved in cell wall biosynthesis
MASFDHSEISSAPLVSVSITSYNSENFLVRALESVLMQRTTFPIEIVVGDDCSKDSTVAIARAYEKQHEGVVHVIERSKNVGMQRNYYEVFERCTGKYIAWLDADDFWTDPDKLTMQVQSMESDASISASAHYVRWALPDGSITQEKRPFLKPGRYGLAEIIHQNFVPSPSILFRNGLHRNLPEWYFDLTGLVDWPILVLAALSGDIVLLDRVMANYSLNPQSAYMSKGSIYQDVVDLEFCKRMDRLLPPQFHKNVRATTGKRYESIAYGKRRTGDYAGARKAALQAFCAPDLLDNCGSKTKALFTAFLGQWLL